MARIRFGALGAGRITPAALLEPARRHPGVEVRAIASRSRRRARRLAAKGGAREVLGHYREVVEHPEVDAIYIALPVSHHREWTLRALAAGKAVLCEKPFAANEREAREMAEAADRAGLLLVEAFHHRYHPVFERALEICRSGAIGDLRRLTGVFHGPVRRRRRFRRNIRLDYATGGGATMDRGCYPLSWLRHLTGEEPEVVSAEAVVGPPETDLRLDAELAFPGGATSSRMRGSRCRAGCATRSAGARSSAGSGEWAAAGCPRCATRTPATADSRVLPPPGAGAKERSRTNAPESRNSPTRSAPGGHRSPARTSSNTSPS